MSSLSVIIPTHKRADVLRRTLEHLEHQTIVDELEVLVVNDVQGDAACDLTQKNPWNMNLRYFEVGPCHQGKARNVAVRQASSPYCLFIGDDILLQPDACEKHLEALSGQKQRAVLGFTTWDPSLDITQTMRWLEESGWQFGYPHIAAYAGKTVPAEIQHQYTYTSNISVHTDIAKEQPFSEEVTLYGWEDVLWGSQLRDAGVELFYKPEAKAFHHHHINLSDSLKRIETLGESVEHIAKIDPSFDRRPRGVKQLGYRLSACFPTMAGRHRRAFLRGMKNVHSGS